MVRKLFLPAVLFVFLPGCATYYQQNLDFNSQFEKGDLQTALTTLRNSEEQARGRSRFIYFGNNGLLLSILGQYEQSNHFFEKAFLFGEDYRINYVNEAISYLTNPTVTVYRGEDHEHLMLLYFKAINYLKMNEPEKALIECRRMNIRLNQLSDKYKSERKFQHDAFIHNLMGIIYQSTGDYNNAFIAYRNALTHYEGDYATMFQATVPPQLKLDLLNTAYWSGLTEEFDEFKTRFNLPDYQPKRPDAELVFFWHNGLCPVKSEWSVNFAVVNNGDGNFLFVNDQLGVSFPFNVSSEDDRKSLADLEIFRVAFPRYILRPEYYRGATILTDSVAYPLQKGEDISRIAFKSLEQRMMAEFAKGLLRAALKKAAEHSVKKEDENLGAMLGVINAMTEKADTRNWQTLPSSIYYARVPLREGDNQVEFRLRGPANDAVYRFKYVPQKAQTLFHTFSSLETTATGGYVPFSVN